MLLATGATLDHVKQLVLCAINTSLQLLLVLLGIEIALNALNHLGRSLLLAQVALLVLLRELNQFSDSVKCRVNFRSLFDIEI